MVIVILGYISMTVALYGCSWSCVAYICSNDMKKYAKEEKLLNHICVYIYTCLYRTVRMIIYIYMVSFHGIARFWICLHLRVNEYSYSVLGIRTYMEVYRHTYIIISQHA